MSFEEFQKSVSAPAPPDNLSGYLESLWYDAKGNWNKAHEIIQDIEDKNGAWIHSYLHRKEGDIGNADYWYRKAGKSRPDHSLEAEWENIVKTQLQ
ncbi:MAG: hypothetical protein ACHQF0_13090 [Chitinophagales bacterium]